MKTTTKRGLRGGVMPTLNAFDNGDVRTTVLVMRMREGKPGGGKGPLMSEDKSLTLATANDQTLFIFENRYDEGIRINDSETSPTVRSAYGTGGGNVPMVAYPIQGNMIGRSDTAGPVGKGYGEDGDPMFSLTSTDKHAIAYDEFNDSVADTHHTLRAGTKQSTGVVMVASPLEARFYKGANAESAAGGHLQTNGSTVCRLTPVECERLQGFPDDWTAGQSDSTRYKQMGNAVAVPVVEWLIGNICDIV